ncbi:GPI-phospholipase A2 activity regulator [Schizosaccharomyces japonicus yFS275]|uniref:Post-GPI attachment to proteins factor 3 n=1 Tax=Schizosaccharomyces japonicus (strain yFS275 / FY16936) TaxID=402676 RepID=B6K896_SCHJY|nr:GPI-phospholipase A2 activity regulator [Schizosaccharomyces japonicus yFS275]EEB09750.1 GPI-phospholipase A2 activity regulator [Schizosaccharomyces japonicus yFS275]
MLKPGNGFAFKLVLAVTVLFCVFTRTAASRGDQLLIFQKCVNNCISKNCVGDGSDTDGLSWYLKLTHWTCGSNCDYSCQGIVSQMLKEAKLPAEQFHGKWYFIRFFGIQELLSVLFSIFNFITHYRGMKKIIRLVPDSHPNKKRYIAWCIVGMNAWLWSSVFHVRDTKLTEKLDYFSAGGFVLFGLYNTVMLLFRIDKWRFGGFITFIWSVICGTAYILHISYLSFYTFDYGYNMLANVIVGLLQNLLWFYYSWSHRKLGPSWTTWPAFIVISLMAAMSLELFDFAPLADLLDAHALWHLSTVPITYYLYEFLVRESQYSMMQEKLAN